MSAVPESLALRCQHRIRRRKFEGTHRTRLSSGDQTTQRKPRLAPCDTKRAERKKRKSPAFSRIPREAVAARQNHRSVAANTREDVQFERSVSPYRRGCPEDERRPSGSSQCSGRHRRSRATPVECHKSNSSDEHQLEPDVEIEDVACKKSAIHCREHGEKQRVEARATASRTNIRPGKHSHRKSDNSRDGTKRSTQSVRYERHAERRPPPAKVHHYRWPARRMSQQQTEAPSISANPPPSRTAEPRDAAQARERSAASGMLQAKPQSSR